MKYFINKKESSLISCVAGEVPEGFIEVDAIEYNNFSKAFDSQKKEKLNDRISISSEKLDGFVYSGTKCSTTKTDGNGLMIVKQGLSMGAYSETTFLFSNGSELRLTKKNIDRFLLKWMKARQKYFKGDK